MTNIMTNIRYAKDRGKYYVQLEDDLITKDGFVSTMSNFAAEKTAEHKSWWVNLFSIEKRKHFQVHN